MLPVLFLISLNEVSGESLVKIGNGGVMYAKSKLGKGADGRYYYCSPYGDGSRELKLQIKRKGVYHICYCINPWNTINTGSGYKANSYVLREKPNKSALPAEKPSCLQRDFLSFRGRLWARS